MDDNEEQRRSDPFAEFGPVPCWPLLGSDPDGRYFFGVGGGGGGGGDRDGAVLSEFGWSLPGAGSVGARDCFGGDDDVGHQIIMAAGEGTGSGPRGSGAAPLAAACGGAASTSNRTASSESSEDPQERSAASGESLLAPEKP